MATIGGSSLDASSMKVENVDRIFKNFTYKCLQVIVQSRIETQTVRTVREPSLSDYFCILIPDNPFIEEQIRKVLDGVKSFPVKEQSVCIEISLVTNDGDKMILETWELSFNLSSLDMSANRIQHIFTRMGVTLKSLLSATRAIPAYRLAKNQGENNGGYRLNYRFYLGKPQTHFLGDGFRTVRAGSVPTAFGLLTISASFRTKLLLSSEMAGSATAAIEVTDNYFVKESRASSAVSNPKPCTPLNRSPSSRSESPYCFAVSPSSLEQEDSELAARLATDDASFLHNSIFSIEEFPEPIMGAFSAQKPPSHRKMDQEVPFEGLMKRSLLTRHLIPTQKIDRGGESNVDGDSCDKRKRGKQQGITEDEKENCLSSSVDIIGEQKMSLEDEYVMVDKPPFAADDDPRDAKSFLSSMYRAANLYQVPDSKISVADYLSDVEALVFKLEEDMPGLDEFCQSVITTQSREDDGDIPLYS